jgi:quercetin dioxygenase-like cupin family protein
MEGEMKILEINEIPRDPLVNPLFTGSDVTRQSVVSDSKDLSVGIVNFGRGVRNKFHSHDGDQVLIISAGKGIVATETEKRIVTVGEVVVFPAGEKHWHGALPDSEFSHIVITRVGVKLTPLED